jgi:hypothetical protein
MWAMYGTLSYDLNAGKEPIEDVRATLLELFDDRESCDLLSDTFICTVEDAADFLELSDALKELGKTFAGQFQFVFTLHEPTDPLRANGKYPKQQARNIMKGEE